MHTSTQKLIAEIKGLVMDATRKANSGHPGGAFSSSDFAAILFSEYLSFSPKHPKWHNRDRFVLSAGHESMLLYALLHFAGLLSTDDLKKFRQIGSLTPGHPENHLTPGVEATTGPLGQGVSMAVGMAMGEKITGAQFGTEFCNHKVYALVSDGDLQESVALGTCAIAGHLCLNNLVVYYDKNDIQISGKTSRSDSTDYKKLFEALQWQVMEINGHDHEQIRGALNQAKGADRQKPLLIIGNTIMANGAATLQGSHKTHGEPLPEAEIAATKSLLGLDPNEYFFSSTETKQFFYKNLEKSDQIAAADQIKIAEMRKISSDFDKKFSQFYGKPTVELAYPVFEQGSSLATREAFGKVLTHWATELPNLVGGSADLEPSNNTAGFMQAVGDFTAQNRLGRNIAFGVREFPMAAIMNGLALYGGILSFGATFLTFSDYCRNAIRMSAIQELQTLYVFTHDSIFLGEDGPTHQPIEHIASLRAMPNLLVMRPADAHETVACMQVFLQEKKRPSLLALSRQKLPTLPQHIAQNAVKGAYILQQSQPENAQTDVVIFATGSEVHLAVSVAETLKIHFEHNITVVSVPCWELFFEQTPAYIQQVLQLDASIKISIEAGTTFGWERFVGQNGIKIGIDTFGLSAPQKDLEAHFGFETDAICKKIINHKQNQA